jgi:nucleotide-binding universal stress UspA family protein
MGTMITGKSVATRGTNVTARSAPFTIVVPTDFSSACGHALEEAASIARRVPGASIHVLHVASRGATQPKLVDLAGHLRLYLEEKVASLGGLPGVAIGMHVREGEPARAIVQTVSDVGADLVIVGQHRAPHLKSIVLGTVTDWLLRTCPVPVFIAPPKRVLLEKHDPEIEPPCHECVEQRFATKGLELYCSRHAGPAGAAGHVYSYRRELPIAMVDANNVNPTGMPLERF